MTGGSGFSLVLLGASLLSFFLGLRLIQNLSLAAPARFEQLLLLSTASTSRGLVTGMVLSGIFHSSSAITVGVVALVTSGILPLRNSLGIILGSNIGTCFTVQFVTLDLTWFGFPMAVAGMTAALIFRGQRRYLALATAGMGFLFSALTLLQTSLGPIAHNPSFSHFLASCSDGTASAFLAGMAGTAAIQSSTLFVTSIMNFAAQGLITLPAGIAFILGSNVGTCSDTLVAALWGNSAARRVALAHLLLNLLGAAIFLLFINAFSHLISLTSALPARQLANAHLFFNLASSLAALPFTGTFARLLSRPGPPGFGPRRH